MTLVPFLVSSCSHYNFDESISFYPLFICQACKMFAVEFAAVIGS